MTTVAEANRIAATAIAKTRAVDEGTFEITLLDENGATHVVRLTHELVQALAPMLMDRLGDQGSSPSGHGRRLPPLTKRPRRLAVGRGRQEAVVLVRFEDDAPYGLDPGTAADLGHALLDECEAIDRRPARPLQ